MEIQNFQTAIKTYMGDKSKEVSRLLMYAEKLKIKEKTHKYILCVSFHYAKWKMRFPFKHN